MTTQQACSLPYDRMELPAASLQLSDGTGELPHHVCRYGEQVTFCVALPRLFASEEGRLRLFCDDSGVVLWFPMEKAASADTENDRWQVTVDSADICEKGEESGLFYFRFEFETRKGHCIFSMNPDNLRPLLRFEDDHISAFQLLVTQRDYETPKALRGGILYHIFVDRFYKGSISTPRRTDAVYNEDWYEGIPQHAKVPGGEVLNNEFFGGTLWGIAEKLPYLHSLGVTTLYLSPVFTAYSNHKYDTGDYESVDPAFGGDAALENLTRAAKLYGISVICDGVFNHTGDNSRYFNRYGTYADTGAYQSKDSPFYPWYRFRDWNEEYDCWWEVRILPAVHSGHPDFRNYICGPDGVLAKWMRLGVAGWRLDVADELQDSFLNDLRTRVKAENPEAVIYGEVWEDASNKIAYDHRRRYFRGKQLDSVMNYPFKNGILSFIRDGDAETIAHITETIWQHYPDGCVHTLMNLLGTHDTERILTALAAKPAGDLDNDALADLKMTEEERAEGIALLRLASLLQFTLPGIPCIYYGDEAGMEGYRDPFNRRPYPWGREDASLLAWYRQLGKVRRAHTVFADGDFTVTARQNGVFTFTRKNAKETILVCINRGTEDVFLDGCYTDLLTGESYAEGRTVPPGDGVLLKR